MKDYVDQFLQPSKDMQALEDETRRLRQENDRLINELAFLKELVQQLKDLGE